MSSFSCCISRKEPYSRGLPFLVISWFLLLFISSAWAVYTTVRYFIAFAIYHDPIRQRISLALGISCFLSFVVLLLFTSRHLLPGDLRHLLPLKALARKIVPYLASSLQVAPAIVNLVFVFLWRHNELLGRCNWDADVVWRGQPDQCPGSIPWGVWLAGGIARLVITLVILGIYHLLDYLLTTTRRPSSMIASATVIGTPSDTTSKRKTHLRSTSSTTLPPPLGVSAQPPPPRTFLLSRLWRTGRSDAVSDDTSQQSHSTPSHGRVEMMERHPRTTSSLTALDAPPSLARMPILRQTSSHTAVDQGAISQDLYEVPETREIPDDASWVSVSMALRPVYSPHERASDRLSGYYSGPSSSDHHGPDSSAATVRGGATSGSGSQTPEAASPTAGHDQLSEEDLAQFAERFRALVGQINLDVESGMRLDGTPDSEPATPPLHSLLDTHTSYMTLDEFGRPVPSDIRIPVLGRYIRRMPTIESIGSRESAWRPTSPTQSLPSRPPTRATMLSFAASMSDHFPSQPPSRSNSITKPTPPTPNGSGSNGQSNSGRTNSTNPSPIRTRAGSFSELVGVDLTRDGSGASNASGGSKNSSAKTSTGSTASASFHTAQAATATTSTSTVARTEGLTRSRSGSLAAQAIADALTPVAESGESRTGHSDTEGETRYFSPLLTDSPARTGSPSSSHLSVATGSTMAHDLSDALGEEIEPPSSTSDDQTPVDTTPQATRPSTHLFGSLWR